MNQQISRSKQVAALFTRVIAEKRVDAEVDGLGAIRVEYIQGTRFVFVGGHITSMKQVIQDANALDAGGKTEAQRALESLAKFTARNFPARFEGYDAEGLACYSNVVI